MSLVPPSKPCDVRVVKDESSSIHVCWKEPLEPGSPRLVSYKLCYNEVCKDVGMEICFEVINLDEGETYSFTIYAVSGDGTEGPPSDSLTFLMGKSKLDSSVKCQLL